MKLDVRYAKLHSAYFSNGTGNLGDVLETGVRHPGMVMTYTEAGLFVFYKGVHFVIPLPNVVGATFTSDPFAEKAVQEAPKAAQRAVKIA